MALGFDTGRSQTPITPIIVGENKNAIRLSEETFKEGLFVKPILYPLVAKDKARVRTIVTTIHTKTRFGRSCRNIRKSRKKVEINIKEKRKKELATFTDFWHHFFTYYEDY